MGTIEKNQGIVPAVTPSWPEFTSSAANGTYMLTLNYAVSGTLSMNANVIIIFSGGRFTGTGTISGNNTTFVMPPTQCFDATINFSGTWKMEKVYAENFGDTNGTNAAPAINSALKFSNISGCIVQLLGKIYSITDTIVIRGNNKLQGTIHGPFQAGDSVVSKEGTVIFVPSGYNINAILVQTTGNSSTSDIDCYRFAIKDLTIRHSGSSTTATLGNSIYIEATNVLTPRNGLISNILIQHTTSNGYGIRVSGGSYIEFHNIGIGGGKGVIVTGEKLQEFLWFNKIIFNSVSLTSFEITHGNNIYLTEVDTNDSDVGLMINNSTGGTFNVFVNRYNSARCAYGIILRIYNQYLTRIKVSEATIHQAYGQAKTPVAAIYIDKGAHNSLTADNCIFENINVDSVSLFGTAYRAINDNNNGNAATNITNSRFINIKTIDKINLNTGSVWPNNQLSILSMIQGGILRPGVSSSSYTHTFYASPNSPLPGKPIVVVSTNTTIPFSVTSSNVQGGACTFTVTFSSLPPSSVEIYFQCTGYFST